MFRASLKFIVGLAIMLVRVHRKDRECIPYIMKQKKIVTHYILEWMKYIHAQQPDKPDGK